MNIFRKAITPFDEGRLYCETAVAIHGAFVMDDASPEFGMAPGPNGGVIRIALVPIAPYTTTGGKTVTVTELEVAAYLQSRKPTVTNVTERKALAS